jgi:ABC-2 type transport system ATP-binding protein
VNNLTKAYGPVVAVDRLSFSARPGRATGFLGPNGAGKTTTLRVLVGLARPTSGSATIGWVVYRELRDPARTVGAVLDSMGFHPNVSASGQLRVRASAAGVARARVDEVLGLVHLADAAGRNVGGYSLGMRQRLSLAAALLGDPPVQVLDEPLDGLDPEGIRWMRELMRKLAAEGRTILVSSHLLAEVANTVDDVVVVSQGRLVAEEPWSELSRKGEDLEEVFFSLIESAGSAGTHTTEVAL